MAGVDYLQCHRRSRWILLIVLALSCLSVCPATALSFLQPGRKGENKIVKIQVCQNKDCCKRYRGALSLPETFRDLMSPKVLRDEVVHFETTGCLSHCGKGPNVVVASSKDEITFNGVVDSVRAVQVLESSPLYLEVPTKLAAAAKVLEKAQKGECE